MKMESNDPAVPERPGCLRKPGGSPADLLRLIWTYKMHYVIVIPALLLLLVFKIIPFLGGIYLSFIRYQPFKGLGGSEWVGWDNYAELLNLPFLRDVMESTLTLKLGYMLACGAAAFVIALLLGGIRSRRLRGFFSGALLVPYFLPSVIVAYSAMLVLSENGSPFPGLFGTQPLVRPELFRPIMIALETVKTVGIPVLIALAAIGRASAPYGLASRVLPALRAVVAAMLLQLSVLLTTDFELLHSMANPLVAKTGTTWELMYVSMSYMQMNVGPAAAAGVIQFAVQLVFTVASYLLVRGSFMRDLFGPRAGSAGAGEARGAGSSAVGIAAAAVCALPAVLLLYLLFLYPFAGSGTAVGADAQPPADGGLPGLRFGNYMLYLWITLVSTIVHMLMTLTLAFPLTARRLPGRGLYKLFLLAAMTMGAGMFHEYLFMRTLGMANTFFPQLLYGFFAIAPVFVLKSVFNAGYGDRKELAEAEGRGELHAFLHLYLPAVWRPLVGLGVLQFAALWNSYLFSFLNSADPTAHSPVMQFYMMTAQGGAPLEVLKTGAVVSLPSLILPLVCRKWLTSEVMLGTVRKL